MHRARALVAVLLMVHLSLSGCLGGAEEPEDDDPREGPAVVTRPDDSSALTNASSSNGGWHVHDYWGGAERLTILHGERSIGSWSCTCERIDMRFRGDSGMIVPLGTAAIEVVVEWEPSEEGRHGQPELWVKPANAAEPALVSTLENGVPITFNTTNEEADPPHQVLSRWEFWVMLPALDGSASWAGVVRVHAEAVRGLEIPPFPPHPDLWNGATELPLLDEENAFVLESRNPQEGSRRCTGCLETHKPDDGVIVPYDASEVVVTLTYAPGMPVGLGLRTHGGDTWDMEIASGDPMLPDTVIFRIPVTPKNSDSPYATQSLWEFEVFIDQPTPEQVFFGGYTLSAKVVA